MLTQFEMDAIMRGVHALENIAEELRNLRDLKSQELKEFEKKSNVLHEMFEAKKQEPKVKNSLN